MLHYDRLLKKETALYSLLPESAGRPNSFIVNFCNYANFLQGEGKTLILKVCEEFNVFNKQRETILQEKKELIEGFRKITEFLKEKVSEFNIENTEADFSPIKSTLEKADETSFYNGAFLMDYRDLFIKFIDKGYEDKICHLFIRDKFNTPVIVLEKEHVNLKNKKELFEKSFVRTNAFFLDIIFKTYQSIGELKDFDTTKQIDNQKNIIEQIRHREKSRAFGDANMTLDDLRIIIELELLAESIDIIHNYILNNEDISSDISDRINYGKVFYLKDGKICHYIKGELQLLGEKEPEYITMFKRALEHLSDTERIRIDEFEKKVKGKKFGKRYRLGIGASSTNFANFLKKNGVTNINPINKRPAIEATDIYITVNNALN